LSENFANLDLNWKIKVITSQYQIPWKCRNGHRTNSTAWLKILCPVENFGP